MTPIVLTLCQQAHITNARLLLLGQFVAANTLSMGLLIGSPTNLIVAADLGLNFLDYFRLMLVPSLLAVGISFLVLHGINSLTPRRWRRALQWQYAGEYLMPALKQQPEFTPQMRYWIGGFGMLLVAVAMVSYLPQLPFITVTAPAFFVTLYALYRWGQVDGSQQAADATAPPQPADLWLRSLGDLPYQIVFFAAAFFIIAEAISLRLDSTAIIAAFDHQNPWLAAALPMLGTGLLVNLVNDLPAAALIGEVLSAAPATADNTIFLQAVLVGLNIACYVTPIGALAGIIWFHIMRTSAGAGMILPTRPAMVLYGATHFFITTMALSVLLPFSALLVSPAHSIDDHPVLFAVGLPALLLALLLLRSILSKERVYWGDLRGFLSAASWLQVRSQRTAPLLMVRTMQATRDQAAMERVSQQIACGEIYTRRIVILDYHPNMCAFVRCICQRLGASIYQTILYTDHKPPPQWEQDRHGAAIYTRQCVLDSVYDCQNVVADYRLQRADEIYLLGDKFIGEHGHHRVLALLQCIERKLEAAPAVIDGDGVRLTSRRQLILAGVGDPEDRAGRLPRIFLWDDVRLEDTTGMAAVERLIVRLPHAWREPASAQGVPCSRMIEAVAMTAGERSWCTRRRTMDQYIGA